MRRFGPKRQPGPLKVIGATKVTNSINFFKKRENWKEILTQAMSNVAQKIRDNAEKKIYQRWKKRTGKLGQSIFWFTIRPPCGKNYRVWRLFSYAICTFKDT
jgi:hypothetical protein